MPKLAKRNFRHSQKSVDSVVCGSVRVRLREGLQHLFVMPVSECVSVFMCWVCACTRVFGSSHRGANIKRTAFCWVLHTRASLSLSRGCCLYMRLSTVASPLFTPTGKTIVSLLYFVIYFIFQAIWTMFRAVCFWVVRSGDFRCYSFFSSDRF